MEELILTAAVLPLVAADITGCSASGIPKVAQMADQARKVQKTAATVEQVTGQDMGMIADPLNMKGRAEAAKGWKTAFVAQAVAAHAAQS